MGKISQSALEQEREGVCNHLTLLIFIFILFSFTIIGKSYLVFGFLGFFKKPPYEVINKAHSPLCLNLF